MAQNMENTDFCHFFFFQLLHNNGLHWSKTVIFEFFGKFLTSSIEYFVKSCFIFWENAKNLQKYGPGVLYPLKWIAVISK